MFKKKNKNIIQNLKNQKKLTKKFSKSILNGKIISTENNIPDINKYIIEIFNINKIYFNNNSDIKIKILKNINLKIKKKDFVVILGPSGSGKTSLLNIISGLDKATNGDVFVLGYNLSLLKDSDLTKFRKENIGFIFQQYNLLPNLTAKENSEVGENLRKNNSKIFMSINEIFNTIGMEKEMNKYPHEMSGGQQQRVSIARALAKNPNILFGDEPTGALDEKMGKKVLEILVNVNRIYKTTIIIVTHNPNIANIANKIIYVKNGIIEKIKSNYNIKKPNEIDWS